MSMTSVQAAKANFFNLLSQVEKNGVPVLICRNGKPVAKLVRHEPGKRNVEPHPRLRKIKINYDPTEPLIPEELGRRKTLT